MKTLIFVLLLVPVLSYSQKLNRYDSIQNAKLLQDTLRYYFSYEVRDTTGTILSNGKLDIRNANTSKVIASYKQKGYVLLIWKDDARQQSNKLAEKKENQKWKP